MAQMCVKCKLLFDIMVGSISSRALMTTDKSHGVAPSTLCEAQNVRICESAMCVIPA